jgi:hypothetical protein
MSDFFRRLVIVANGEKNDLSPKPAITPDALPDYVRNAVGFHDYPKSPLEESQSSDLTQLQRINGKNDANAKNDEVYDRHGARDAHHRKSAKSSLSNSSEAKLDASAIPPMSPSPDYFSDIIASARDSIRHDLKTMKPSSSAGTNRLEIRENVRDRVTPVKESPMDIGGDHPNNSNNHDQQGHDGIPDYIGERKKHLQVSPKTPYYFQAKDKSAGGNNHEHVVTINIGSIEIHASKEEKRFQKREEKKQKFPSLSLSEYLQKRSDANQ